MQAVVGGATKRWCGVQEMLSSTVLQ
jgi:hypothetical protein